MYLTRAAGIETDFEYLFAFYFWKMYLTRVAGMSLRLPCKAVRNRKTLRQFVGAGHAPPATYRKTQPDGQPIGRAMLAPTTLGKRLLYILPALRELKQ